MKATQNDFGDPRLPQRFWDKAHRQDDGCWHWSGYRDRDGYGHFFPTCNTAMLAHRHILIELGTEIAAGLEVDHLCRVRCCVNPDHLEVVTRAENNLRKMRARTHCRNGHAYVEYGFIDRRGVRICRGCQRNTSKRSNAAIVPCPTCGELMRRGSLAWHRKKRGSTCKTQKAMEMETHDA